MNAVNKFLETGDVVEIEQGMKIGAKVPKHFCFSNRVGDYELCHYTFTVANQFAYFAGKYVVTHTALDGGGTGHGPHDVYPNGHHVHCINLDNPNLVIDFYQSGCFTHTIKDIVPIGKATATTSWTYIEG